MNNLVAQQKASTYQNQRMAGRFLELFHHLDLIPIPLKPKSKIPLVKWSDESWKPTPVELEAWASKPGVNWGVLCGENLAVIDFDSEDDYFGIITALELPPDCPVVVKPKKPIRSQRVGSIEIKCLGSYVVAPYSVHPCSVPYVFRVLPNRVLQEIVLGALFNMLGDDTGSSGTGQTDFNVPCDFALRYGKSPYGQTLYGLVTKRLLSLRCWKWYCFGCERGGDARKFIEEWQSRGRGIECGSLIEVRTYEGLS